MPDSPEKRVFYAIGDVHGEIAQLKTLNEQIAAHRSLFHGDKPAVLVHLGDYVDRGPDSFAVIETLMKAEARTDFEVCSIMGNHERMMLDAQADSAQLDFWLRNGGRETIESYERRGHEEIPEAHLKWIAALPDMLWFEEEGLIFVHAGVSPTRFPDEDEGVRLWTRSAQFFNPDDWTAPALEGQTVIHGHTPTDDFEPDVSEGARRINVDTGACYGGPLTAVCLAEGEEAEFLSA